MTRLSMAIAKMEGWFAKVTPPNRPQRNNNPGNINMEPWLGELYGAVMETIPEGYHSTPRFAHFPSALLGFQALDALLAGPHYANLTIEGLVNRYAPPSENDVNTYVNEVCEFVPCQPTDIVKDVIARG